MNTKMTVAFFGASTGVGLSALKHTLAAGHQCVALCRNPSKLTALLPPETTPNLRIIQGNAHDVAAVSKCLQTEDGKLVDMIVSTIGAKPQISGLKVVADDPQVCQKGMATMLEALAQLRSSGITGNPHIVVCSTTYTSRFGRDIPILMTPVYSIFVKAPARDKIVMEDRLTASGETYSIVRPSHLTDGESAKPIRVGVEDPKKGREVEVIGYSISREDAGKWVANNLVLSNGQKYRNKIAVVTY